MGGFRPPNFRFLTAAATTIATTVITATQTGNKDNPNNPFAAVIVAVSTKERITATIVVATTEKK